MTEEVYINPEETLKFTKDVNSYKVEMLPKHELFRAILHKFGGRVEDPKCMDYNSWVSSGVFVGKDSKLSNTQLYSGAHDSLSIGALQVTDSTLTDCIIETGELFYNLINRCNLSGLKSSGSFGRDAAGLEFSDVSMIGDILTSTVGKGVLLRMNNVDVRGLLRLDLKHTEKSIIYVEGSIFNGNVMLTVDVDTKDTEVHITDCGFTGNLIVDVKENLENKWHR